MLIILPFSINGTLTVEVFNSNDIYFECLKDVEKDNKENWALWYFYFIL